MRAQQQHRARFIIASHAASDASLLAPNEAARGHVIIGQAHRGLIYLGEVARRRQRSRRPLSDRVINAHAAPCRPSAPCRRSQNTPPVPADDDDVISTDDCLTQRQYQLRDHHAGRRCAATRFFSTLSH